jgi:hypothetical protein
MTLPPPLQPSLVTLGAACPQAGIETAEIGPRGEPYVGAHDRVGSA